MTTFANSEADRLAAVRRYDLLDTPPDGAFDSITHIAAQLFSVPIALVSLVDEDRIWFKSRHGLDAAQTDRAPGLCASAILSDSVYTVLNASTDPRTLSNPLVVGALGLRFYAAAPLRTPDGFNLGTLCVIDRQPRVFEASDRSLLERLAAIVMDEMELRLAGIKLGQQVLREQHLRQEVEAAHDELRIFGAAASHDLRAPLRQIATLAGALQAEHGATLGEPGRRGLEQISVTTHRMDGMLDELYRYAQLSFQVPEITRVDVAQLIAALLVELSPGFPDTRIHYEATPCSLVVDKVGMALILRNVIHNALTYSASQLKPEVVIRTRSLPLSVVISVMDNGVGIDSQDRESLLRMFHRTQQACRLEGSGTGQALARKAMDRMGVRVRVNGAPGRGSAFELEFPASTLISQYPV